MATSRSHSAVNSAATTVITMSPASTNDTIIFRVRGFTTPAYGRPPQRLATLRAMADLRLYGIGIDEVLRMYGAESDGAPEAQALRDVLRRDFGPEQVAAAPGGLRRLGRLFQRAPQASEPGPTDPTANDIDAFLTGDSIAPDRVGATWRIQECLVANRAWGSTRLALSPQDVDDIDFALARGGVSAAVGLRHLLSRGTAISLVPVRGLTVGWHDHQRAVAMAGAFREALDEVPPAHQETVAGLVSWLDGFPHWADVAESLGRPAPDLIGFWVH